MLDPSLKIILAWKDQDLGLYIGSFAITDGVWRLDKDCELQKIAVFHSHLEANVNAQYTFLAGGLIGILVLFFTLFYEGVFDVLGGRLLGLIP